MTLSRPEEPFIEECFFLSVLPFSRRRLGASLRSPEEQVALPEMAISCASHRRVTGCFRIAVTVIPHDEDC
jgi:hypothetical protein